MRVVLKRDVADLGQANEIKEVSDGYARNYLLPQGLAVRATAKQVNIAKQQRASERERQEELRIHSEQIAERLKEQPFHFKAKAGEHGHLYGSVTAANIAERIGRILEEPFDKRQVDLDESIRELGIYLVDLDLAGGVDGQVRVVVEEEENE